MIQKSSKVARTHILLWKILMIAEHNLGIALGERRGPDE